MFDSLSIPSQYVWWIVAFSVVMFFGSLAAIPVVVARMRTDYFVHREPPQGSWVGRHPAIRVLWRIARNIFGGLLVLLGLVMSVPGVPGQGLLTVLIGLMLLEFPGKRRMELWLVRKNAVRKTIGWIREKAGRKPLEIPDEDEEQKKQPGQ